MPLLPDNTLYFLDAHWEDYLPLPDEIRAIRPGTGIIVIHDFTVPGHPEWDCPVRCNGRDIFLSHDYLREVLNEWSPTHVLHYNDRVEGTNFLRGVAYIFPH